MQYKMRRLVVSNSKEVYGVTIPSDQAIFFKDVFFNIEISGTSIILSSGTHSIITQKDINNFNIESLRI